MNLLEQRGHGQVLEGRHLGLNPGVVTAVSVTLATHFLVD